MELRKPQALARLGTTRALRHWHAVLIAKDLKHDPVAVSVLGEKIVLFRTPEGIGAVQDRCPHRGARLSAGTVKDGCIECPYHLWRFGRDGRGVSPANPGMRPLARAFDAAEHVGLLWVRAKGSEAALPTVDVEGLAYIGHETTVIEAPFYLVVDNFTEIEHSPKNHALFAFDAEGIPSVQIQTTVLEDSLHVVYTGPQRPVPWWASPLYKAGSKHIIDFKVRFDPIHWIYDLRWEDPKTGQPLPMHVRQHAFITPRDDRSTSVFLVFHSSLSMPAPVRRMARFFFMRGAGVELALDKRICENVAGMEPSPTFERLQLGKFDRVLKHTRALIAKVYDGPAAVESDVAGPVESDGENASQAESAGQFFDGSLDQG